MERVLYADVLFLIDFSMDTVAVWLTARLMHVKTSAKRLMLAACIGALASVVLTAVCAHRWVSVSVGILSAYIMSRISFGCRGVKVIKHTCALWVMGFLLGGVMSSLTSGKGTLNEAAVFGDTSNGGIKLLPIAVLLCSALVFVVGRASKKGTVDLKVSLFDNHIKEKGIVDSGNLLCDPISGYPIVLLSRSAACKLIRDADVDTFLNGLPDDVSENLRPRYRAVFAKGATGERMLPCLRADEILIDQKPCRALIGITDSENFGEDIYGIVPSSLV
ncbi:MAG: sigma-E processing peptidase SpoIIGA [Clostridia bacterium]|nr:sigma-E processing peptidase SpoIIGA [Clostridia bacterium]